MEKQIKLLINAANAFDVEAALNLFADKAIIDDVSVGEKFVGKSGIRSYLETFFVGYQTKTRLVSLEIIDTFNAKIKVDFSGKFGAEKGGLDFTFDNDGLIKNIDAYLEQHPD